MWTCVSNSVIDTPPNGVDKMAQQFMDMIPCRKPAGKLTLNTGTRRIRCSDGGLYHQYLQAGRAYNTDGKRWYRCELNIGRVRAHMAAKSAVVGLSVVAQ